MVALTLGRACFRQVSHLVLPPERVLFVGTGAMVDALMGKMRSHPEYGLVSVGRIADVTDAAVAGDEQLPLGGLDEFSEVAARERVDRMVVADGAIDADRLLEVVREGTDHGLKICLLPDMHDVLGVRTRRSAANDNTAARGATKPTPSSRARPAGSRSPNRTPPPRLPRCPPA